MFGRRRKRRITPYDRGSKIPVIHSSICTGERVAGFKDPISGRFEEVMLLQTDDDLQEFLSQYQVVESEIKWE